MNLTYYLFRHKNSVSDPHFFADPDPGKNLHADPDPGGIRGVKGKMNVLTFQIILINYKKKLERIYESNESLFGSKLPVTDD